MNDQPVFIHSLFRAGSTYLFKVFRRSPDGYWCYQEPLHEGPLAGIKDPELLLSFDVSAGKSLRHPTLTTGYYQELYDVFGAWRGVLTKEALFDDAFRDDGRDASIPFFRALIDAARGVPVIQECRTSWRIKGLKQALGGLHLYLWRDPWDQWWSCQINDYFDAAVMLIINARDHPRAVAHFREEIGFQALEDEEISRQLAHLAACPLSPSVRYQAFYLLWCLGLQEGRLFADLLLSIDGLSDDPTYRNEVMRRLETLGLGGLDLSDCRIPQTVYGAEDREFFLIQEEKVHEILIQSGWSREDLSGLLTLREKQAPRLRRWLPETEREIDLARDAERARSLARRFSGRDADGRNMAREQARLLQEEYAALQERNRDLELAVRHHQESSAAARGELEAVYRSRSWRITRPLRTVLKLVNRAKTARKE